MTPFTPKISFDSKPHEVVKMEPEKFLQLSLPKDMPDTIYDPSVYDQESLQNLKFRLQHDLFIDSPSLEVDIDTNEVVNHSGHHRALSAKIQGIKKIPVILYFVEFCLTLGDKIRKSYVQPPKKYELKPETFRRKHEIKRICGD